MFFIVLFIDFIFSCLFQPSPEPEPIEKAEAEVFIDIGNIGAARVQRRRSSCMAIPRLETIPEEGDEFGDDIENLFT